LVENSKAAATSTATRSTTEEPPPAFAFPFQQSTTQWRLWLGDRALHGISWLEGRREPEIHRRDGHKRRSPSWFVDLVGGGGAGGKNPCVKR
jgi:hypothetical protein